MNKYLKITIFFYSTFKNKYALHKVHNQTRLYFLSQYAAVIYFKCIFMPMQSLLFPPFSFQILEESFLLDGVRGGRDRVELVALCSCLSNTRLQIYKYEHAVTLDKLYTFQCVQKETYLSPLSSVFVFCGIEISNNVTISLKWKQQPPQSEIMHHSMHTFIHF